MPSFRYRAVSALLRLLPVKKMLSAPPEKLMRAARKLNAGRGFQIPKDPSFSYRDITVEAAGQAWHCLRITPKNCDPAGALLYIYGGGMISAPDMSDIAPALQLAKQTGREVWFPFYPLCLDYSAMASLQMVAESYRKMSKAWTPERICILGYSSGACLALALSHFIRESGGRAAQPGTLILFSPGAITSDPAWHERAKALAKKDILVGYPFLDSITPMMSHGEKLPEWFLNPWSASFAGFPKCHFWFGGDELLAASVPNFEAACQAAKVPFTMTVGEGMCHCYPFIPGPSFPEKQAALAQIAAQISAG